MSHVSLLTTPLMYVVIVALSWYKDLRECESYLTPKVLTVIAGYIRNYFTAAVITVTVQ